MAVYARRSRAGFRSLGAGKRQSFFAGVNAVKYHSDVGSDRLFFDLVDNGKQLDRHRAKDRQLTNEEELI